MAIIAMIFALSMRMTSQHKRVIISQPITLCWRGGICGQLAARAIAKSLRLVVDSRRNATGIAAACRLSQAHRQINRILERVGDDAGALAHRHQLAQCIAVGTG